MSLSDQDQALLSAYLRTVCEPLLDRAEELSVRFEGRAQALAAYGCPEHTAGLFLIGVSPDQVGYLLGKGGVTAESVRHLARCWMAARKWRLRVDVRVCAR